MVFDHIEKLKREYTDKYVVVDDSRPELRRFKGLTGTVRTVNMSGRALVEFDAYNNIGWYDVDIDFLKVIDAPLAKEDGGKKEAAKKPAAKAPAKKAPSALEKARSEKTPAAKGESGMSVADILAAARSTDKGGATKSAPTAEASSDPSKMSVADMLAAARAEKGGGSPKPSAAPAEQPAKAAAEPAAKKDPSTMSVQEMLAAARAEKSGGAAEAAATTGTLDEKQADVAKKLESARTRADADTAAEKPAAKPAADPSKMSVAEMLAAARAEKSGGAANATDTATAEPEASEPAAAEESPAAAEAEPPAAAPSELPTDVEGMLAYCRKVDGK